MASSIVNMVGRTCNNCSQVGAQQGNGREGGGYMPKPVDLSVSACLQEIQLDRTRLLPPQVQLMQASSIRKLQMEVGALLSPGGSRGSTGGTRDSLACPHGVMFGRYQKIKVWTSSKPTAHQGRNQLLAVADVAAEVSIRKGRMVGVAGGSPQQRHR
jgi:hypothetical protein